MIHLFINGLGASAGGGLTYLNNVLPLLSNEQVRTTVVLGSSFPDPNPSGNVQYVRIACSGSAAQRFWFEQRHLAAIIRRSGANVLLSPGNFALRNSPVPQILLSRNSLYTSPHFYRDLIARGEYRMWLETRLRAGLAKLSITWADRTIAPSAAFARELERWTSRPIVALHHGFDGNVFVSDRNELPEDVRQKLNCPAGVLRLLLVSHYNYYRNFETVFRAIAKFTAQLGAPEVRLFLTCELKKDKTFGGYNPESASALIERLGIRKHVIELGAIPYPQLHHLYRACDAYVTAAYSETFAHPLVEAMSCGLPVVASDLPVHREVCDEAALYFSPFSEDQLAAQLLHLSALRQTRGDLAQAGLRRSQAFSWKSHVDSLLGLADELLRSSNRNHSTSRAASAA